MFTPLIFLLLAGQIQEPYEFYGIKLEIVNKPEIKRDLVESWYDRVSVDVVDEDSRLAFHIIEELEIDSIDAIIGHQFVTNVNNFLQFQMLNDVLESSL